MPPRRSKPPRQPSLADILGINTSNLRGLASMFMQGVEVAAGPQKRLMDQMGQFAAHFSRNAVTTLVGNLPGVRCCMADCGQEAVLLCMSCGQPVCLAHVHVSHRADGICDQCVRESMERHGKQPPQPARADADAKALRAAFKVFDLTDEATWAEVQRAHRILAAQHHPDKQRTPAARKRAEEKSKEINSSFEVLRKHYERKAA
jgi:hypothetical protein